MIAIMKHANPNPNPISYPNPNITHNCNSEPYNLFLANKRLIGQHCFKSALVQAETNNKQQDTKATTRHVHPRAAHSACLLTSHSLSHTSLIILLSFKLHSTYHSDVTARPLSSYLNSVLLSQQCHESMCARLAVGLRMVHCLLKATLPNGLSIHSCIELTYSCLCSFASVSI